MPRTTTRIPANQRSATNDNSSGEARNPLARDCTAGSAAWGKAACLAGLPMKQSSQRSSPGYVALSANRIAVAWLASQSPFHASRITRPSDLHQGRGRSLYSHHATGRMLRERHSHDCTIDGHLAGPYVLSPTWPHCTRSCRPRTLMSPAPALSPSHHKSISPSRNPLSATRLTRISCSHRSRTQCTCLLLGCRPSQAACTMATTAGI